MPFNFALAEELYGAAIAADGRIEVCLFTAEGQKVWIAPATAVRRRPPLKADGRRVISKVCLSLSGSFAEGYLLSYGNGSLCFRFGGSTIVANGTRGLMADH